jgi:hypothetical protein
LFAVTNDLPAPSVERASVSAGPSDPPISSTTTSTSACCASAIVDPGEPRQIDAAILVAVACRYRDDLDRATGPSGDQLAVRVEQPDDAAPYGSQACQSHAQRFAHRLPFAKPARRPRVRRPIPQSG